MSGSLAPLVPTEGHGAAVLVSEKTGFLIWTKGGRNPRFWHGQRDTAEAEASRLAAKHPGTAFIVVAMVSKHKVAPDALAEAA